MIPLLSVVASVATLFAAFLGIKRMLARRKEEQDRRIGFYMRSQDISLLRSAPSGKAAREDRDHMTGTLSGSINSMIIVNKNLSPTEKDRSLSLLEKLQEETGDLSADVLYGSALGIVSMIASQGVREAEDLVETFGDDAARANVFVNELVTWADSSQEVSSSLKTALRLRTDSNNAHLLDLADEITMEMCRNKV